MKVTDKFILKTYLGPMVLTFFIVMFILLMHFLWLQIDKFLGKGLSLAMIAELLSYASATFIPMALPLATLLASIMTMGNLGEYNELLALKAAGISLPRILRPLIVLMIFVSMGSFFIINDLTPYAWNKMVSLLYDYKNAKHEVELQDGVFFNGFDRMSIRVDHHDKVTKKMTNVLIYDNRNSEKMRTIVADSGYLRMSEDRKYLILTLNNGQIYEQNRNHKWFDESTLSHSIFEYQTTYISVAGFDLSKGSGDLFSSKSEAMNMGQLSAVIDSLRHARDSIIVNFGSTIAKTHVFKRYSAYENLDSLPTLKPVDILKSIDTMNVTDRNFVYEQAKQSVDRAKDYLTFEIEQVRTPSLALYRAQEDYQKKIALPFSIMIFFLIGASLGAIIRKGGLGMPLVISVSFFVFYYIISIAGENFVRDGAMPAYIGVWLSSIILFPIAVFLTYKATNDSALLNSDSYIMKYKQVKAFIVKLFKKHNDKNS